MTPALRPAVLADLAACRGLVQACGLPLAGLELGFPGGYGVAVDAVIVGCAGLEVHGEAGLLRSLAVSPGARGGGLGERLTRSRIDLARALRLSSLWLLTETAAVYFSRLGFVAAARASAPAALARSAEFMDVCPASATCMCMRLSDRGAG